MTRTNLVLPLILALALCAGVMVTLPQAVGQEAADTNFVVKDNQTPSNADIAVALSEITPIPDVERILVARDDEFADALASGVMQDNAPLMLVSPDGIQQSVLDHMATLDTTDVVMLGGEAALPAAIEAQLTDAGFAVQRREGATRIETAVDIATQDTPDATDAILVRGFAGTTASDPTQAFADSLAAGGLAASTRAPILLTESDQLTASTRDYLAASSIQTVRVVGGTAAIAEAVLDDLRTMDLTVERISGQSRADTAVEIAKVRGADSAEDVARVTLVQGQSADAWAGGFAAAAHSAQFDAPIVLGSEVLPPETETFLGAGTRSLRGTPADPEGIRITCVIDAAICRDARALLGLPPVPPAEPPTEEPPTEDPPPTEEPPMEGTMVLATTCQIDRIAVDDDASTILFAAMQGCADLGFANPGFGVVDAATGALSYAELDGVFCLSVDDLGTTALAGSCSAGDTAYDLSTDPPSVIGSVPNGSGAGHSLSGDGSRAGRFSAGAAGDGDFYDIAAAQALGPDVCALINAEGEDCDNNRPISDDGLSVYSPARTTAFPSTMISFNRFDEEGNRDTVDAAGFEGCTDMWPIGTAGDTAATWCDQAMVIVDFVAGTFSQTPIPASQRSRRPISGAADDGTLVSAGQNLLVDPVAGTTADLSFDTSITAVSDDGQWVVTRDGEGIQRIPSADVRP